MVVSSQQQDFSSRFHAWVFGFYIKANRELLEFYAVWILKGLLWGGVENSLEIDLMLCKETTNSSTSGQMC